jgi:oligoendopeptidase F
MFGSDGTPAYVFANYDRDLESLYFLAHELGHVVHYLLARAAQPPTYQRLGWYVGELPSFLGEVLLTHHLLDTDHVPDPVVLDTFLGRITPAPPARGAAFTHRLFDALADGDDLAAADVHDAWRDTGDAFLPPVTLTAADGHRWLALNLDRDPFHAYYYLVGRTCALALAADVADGSFDAVAYREFLRTGDSAYTSDLLDALALDLGSGSVVEAAASEFDRLVAHY